jgi:hypothetical protein
MSQSKGPEMKTINANNKRGWVVPGFGLLLLLMFVNNAKAQWTTNGNDVNKTNTAGNVGVGTTTPQAKASVAGTTGAPSGTDKGILQVYSTDANVGLSVGSYYASPFGMWLQAIDSRSGSTPTYPIILNPAGGNVGVGTTSPAKKLEINQTGTGAQETLRITNSAGGGLDVGLQIGTRDYGSGVVAAFIDATNAGDNNVKPLYLNPSSGAIYTGTGNVGIGTTSPNYKLDVNGTINSNSTITGNNIVAKYQDVAEWVPSSEQLSAGTVVVLDSTKSNQVTSSTVSYDTHVAGVVSAQPGITLGEKSDNKILVATTGRVRVKVDATKNPIHIGDLLVTSNIPGVAMKSEPVEFAGRKMHMPGTLIGKALEPLERGKGEILVLLSLQ